MSRPYRTHKPIFGIGLMIASMALFAAKDGTAKFLVRDMSPAQLLWFHYSFTFVIAAALSMPRHGFTAFIPKPFWLQLVRGVVSFGAALLLYWSLSFIPLADAAALVSAAPLSVTAFSPFLLGERIGIRRIAAVLVGFAGVLVILRPGFGGEPFGYLLACISGILFGLNQIGSRYFAQFYPQIINVAHNVIFGAVMLAPVMPFVWVAPESSHTITLPAFLLLTLVGHSFIVSAFAYAPAPTIAPYLYTSVIFATLIGLTWFGTFPDTVTWVGIAMIVGAGLFVAFREDKLSKEMPEGS